jgi:hypothetical protein
LYAGNFKIFVSAKKLKNIKNNVREQMLLAVVAGMFLMYIIKNHQ